MERTDILGLMGELKLYGMQTAYDEVMGTGIKRQHEPPRIVGDLLSAEIAEKQARSIKYQLTTAKLPLAKDLDDFDFSGTPVNEVLVHDLAVGPSSLNNVMLSSSAAPEPARAISPLPSRGPASETVHAAGSSTSWISSIGWRARPARAVRGVLPII